MKRRLSAGLAGAAMLVASACGGADGGGDKASAKPASKELGRVSSVVELRDALIAAGYKCTDWNQSNIVKLAAESGVCDDASVLSTYASESDLQAQLDTTRELAGLMKENNVEQTPTLVGPNWIFNAPDADSYAAKLGGTVVAPPG